MGQTPTCQARPRDINPLRASNLASRTLSLVEHKLSKFGGDPCPVTRGLVATAMCYMRKARFCLCRHRTERTHHYRRHCPRVSVRSREILFCFLFDSKINVGLMGSESDEILFCFLFESKTNVGLMGSESDRTFQHLSRFFFVFPGTFRMSPVLLMSH